jgi:hypothetical protein
MILALAVINRMTRVLVEQQAERSRGSKREEGGKEV